ncbi:ACP phosphodiesterase [Flavobacterium suaedae]|uniref:ACP phosphodiesterase n=1 Tax=Flavobacterium suaedae TaxID=1767027 RepID=A0ABQ1JGV9_9FLAO|nr:acyl carrier protein phosphodiesterase [Flavobacterium suaedae]GGB68661.1 ACP phosphodiesterase [Flavobacterium suaedae]
MNFLAHIYLSGDNDLLKIGNFMADGVYGKPSENFPEDIQKGIILHRLIDSYTDAHPIFRQSTKRLHPVYHHYSGVIIDIYYDHFLAKNWGNYSDIPLADYTQHFYNLLQENYDVLTEKTKNMIPYMVKYNWLLSYASVEGISRILEQMDKRTKNKSGMRNAKNELVAYYAEFEEEFTEYFEAVQVFVQEKLPTLQS